MGWTIHILNSGGSKDFCLQTIQTSSVAHAACSSVITGNFFCGGKVGSLWSWLLTSI